MHMHLLAVGRRIPAWVQTAFDDYAGRLPRECRLDLVEIAPGMRTQGADAARAVAQEEKRLLGRLPDGCHVVALDERGHMLDTRAFSGKLRGWIDASRDVAFMIGGPDGLSPACLERADFRWSLSALTLPHGLVRVVVAEQVYRAWSMLANHPYHRE